MGRYGSRWKRGRHRGGVLVELALVLPLLITLAIPIYYIVWNIVAQTVITNVAREMANLASRATGYAGTLSMQARMDTVAQMTPPVKLARDGSIFLTVITPDGSCVGTGCQGVATAKWRWNAGGGPAMSKWGSCIGGWDAEGMCLRLSSRPIGLPYAYPGKSVYIAEVVYQLPAWAGLPFLSIPGLNQEPLYAWAIF